MIIFGVSSQVAHFMLLKDFPFFNLTSPQFILAIGTVHNILYSTDRCSVKSNCGTCTPIYLGFFFEYFY